MSSLLPPVNNTILSISALNRQVRECLEGSFPLCWVSGEISNLTYAASGHVYFSLKDGSAQARCVMWRSRTQLLGWRLENGQKIEARVLVSFYEPRGEFQLDVENIQRAGQGDLFERFLQLKAQLEAEGLFAAEHKRPLPTFPHHIGIVTSPQAAALRDVLTTLQRRAPHIRLTIFPTPVQGEGAAEKIAAAVDLANRSKCEAIILCRGGGSIGDLWAFNEECVARALWAASVPVIAGIGHETDFTIVDFAADLRPPTPTAAAELVSPDRNALLARLAEQHNRLSQRMARTLADQMQRLDWLAARLTHPTERLQQQNNVINSLARRFAQTVTYRQQIDQSRLAQFRQRLAALRPQPARQAEQLDHLHFRLVSRTRELLSEKIAKLNMLGNGLHQLDPDAVLARGYAMVTGPDGRIVRNAARLHPGDALVLGFAHGSASAVVDKVVASREAD